MFLYLENDTNRLHMVSKRKMTETHGLTAHCEMLEVPDDFQFEVTEPDENGNMVKREMTAAEIKAAFTYNYRRALEYPPITDYLDGIVKGDQAQIDAYIAACQAVKDKYPKG